MNKLGKAAALTSSILLVGTFLAWQGGYIHFGNFNAYSQTAAAQTAAPQSVPQAASNPMLIGGSKSRQMVSPPTVGPVTPETPPMLLSGSKSFTGAIHVTGGTPATAASPGTGATAPAAVPPASQPVYIFSSKSGAVVSPSLVPAVQTPSPASAAQTAPATTPSPLMILGGSKSKVPLVVPTPVPTPSEFMLLTDSKSAIIIKPPTQPATTSQPATQPK